MVPTVGLLGPGFLDQVPALGFGVGVLTHPGTRRRVPE